MGQRLLVGVTGLFLVVLLILGASAVYRWAAKDTPPDVVGAPNVDTAANIAAPDANSTAPAPADDPLAELGVAPGTKDTDTPAPMPTPSATPAAR